MKNNVKVCSLIHVLLRDWVKSKAQLYRPLGVTHFDIEFIAISYQPAEQCQLIRTSESY